MRRCVVCGARVENANAAANTCDSICTKARNAGLGRADYLRREVEAMPWPEKDLKDLIKEIRSNSYEC